MDEIEKARQVFVACPHDDKLLWSYIYADDVVFHASTTVEGKRKAQKHIALRQREVIKVIKSLLKKATTLDVRVYTDRASTRLRLYHSWVEIHLGAFSVHQFLLHPELYLTEEKVR